MKVAGLERFYFKKCSRNALEMKRFLESFWEFWNFPQLPGCLVKKNGLYWRSQEKLDFIGGARKIVLGSCGNSLDTQKLSKNLPETPRIQRKIATPRTSHQTKPNPPAQDTNLSTLITIKNVKWTKLWKPTEKMHENVSIWASKSFN